MFQSREGQYGSIESYLTKKQENDDEPLRTSAWEARVSLPIIWLFENMERARSARKKNKELL